MDTKLDVADGLALPERTETLLFRIAQEALRNVAAHAEASRVLIRVARDDGTAVLEVEDDGRGFSPDDGGPGAPGHFGLRMLDELTREEGGTLAVDSAPGAGTRIRAEVPVP
jgi:signal transduction histidine kinase